MTIEILLSKRGKKHAGKFVAVVDDIDADLAKLNWSARLSDKTIYAYRNLNPGAQHLHRIILERVLCRPLLPNEQVDHANLSGLDNRRENLRLANSSENSQNRPKQSNNTSGIKGCSWDKQTQKWRAMIGVNRRQISLGYFNTLEEAVEAYAEASKKYHKEFGRLE